MSSELERNIAIFFLQSGRRPARAWIRSRPVKIVIMIRPHFVVTGVESFRVRPSGCRSDSILAPAIQNRSPCVPHDERSDSRSRVSALSNHDGLILKTAMRFTTDYTDATDEED